MIKVDISDDLYFFRNQGLTYAQITKILNDKGIKISINTVQIKCKKVFEEKGEKVPKVSDRKSRNIKTEIEDEIIFDLRESGMSYRDISKYFTSIGKPVCCQTIINRCNKIYASKGISQVDLRKEGRNKNANISDDEIYNLRKQRISYQDIVNYYKERGENISIALVQARCKKIFATKQEKEPEGINKSKINISNEEIYELRKQGLSYVKISEYYKEKGISIYPMTVCRRCKIVFEEKKEEEPKIKRGKPKKTNSDAIKEEKTEGIKELSLQELDNELTNNIKKKTASEELVEEYNKQIDVQKENESQR